MKILYFVLLAALAGCAYTGPKGTGNVVGQPLSAAIAVYGMPTSEATIAGQKVYTWTVGNAYRGCALRYFVGANDIITGGDTNGNVIQCEQFAR